MAVTGKRTVLCVAITVGFMCIALLWQNPSSHTNQLYIPLETNTTDHRSVNAVDDNDHRNDSMDAGTQHPDIKVILQPTPFTNFRARVERYSSRFKQEMNFEGCEYSNCVFTGSTRRVDALKADVILCEVQADFVKKAKYEYSKYNSDQLWLVWNDEPPTILEWKSKYIEDIHGSMTYTKRSLIYWPFGETLPLLDRNQSQAYKSINYTENKTKGAFTYVSHCASHGYDRTKTIEILSKYIQVDFYARCKRITRPCKRMDYKCEDTFHSSSRFYLAFENSLCKEYVTEKFWRRLQSSGYYVPVVMGGFSIDDYTRVAPPDSFIHVLNFTSIEQLGKYLKQLMEDDVAYNRYHAWRDKYYISTSIPQASVCKLCMLANKPQLVATQPQHVTSQWKEESTCTSASLH